MVGGFSYSCKMFHTEINVQFEKKKKSTNLHGKVSGEVLFHPGGNGNGVK